MSKKLNTMYGPHDDYGYIKKKGIIDLQQLYADIWKWYTLHGYEVFETDHKAKTPSPMGTEEEFHISGYRNEDDFTRWWLNIIIVIWDAIPIQVKKKGKFITMYKCRLRVRFEPIFELDYEDKFEKTSLLRGIRNFYVNTIVRRKIQTEGDKFEYEFHELHDLIKRGLDIDAHGDQYDHYWKH